MSALNKALVFDLPGRAFVLGRFPPINVNLPLIILGGGRAIVDGRAMHSIQYMHQSLDGLWQELSTRFVKASTPPAWAWQASWRPTGTWRSTNCSSDTWVERRAGGAKTRC